MPCSHLWQQSQLPSNVSCPFYWWTAHQSVNHCENHPLLIWMRTLLKKTKMTAISAIDGAAYVRVVLPPFSVTDSGGSSSSNEQTTLGQRRRMEWEGTRRGVAWARQRPLPLLFPLSFPSASASPSTMPWFPLAFGWRGAVLKCQKCIFTWHAEMTVMVTRLKRQSRKLLLLLLLLLLPYCYYCFCAVKC